MARKKEERSKIAGQRLRIAKDRLGKSYESLMNEKRWTEIVDIYEPKTIRDWVKYGVPSKKIAKVADFFGIDGFLLTDERILQADFEKYIDIAQKKINNKNLNDTNNDKYFQLTTISSFIIEWTAKKCPYDEIEPFVKNNNIDLNDIKYFEREKDPQVLAFLMICSLHFGKNWKYWVEKNLDSSIAIEKLFYIFNKTVYDRPRLRSLYALQQFSQNQINEYIKNNKINNELRQVIIDYVLKERIIDYILLQKKNISQKVNEVLKEIKNLWDEDIPGFGLFGLDSTSNNDKYYSFKISFDNYISDKTKWFVGRKFIISELDIFLNSKNQKSGYFIIKGEPGIGKTALMAHLVKERYYIHHFNIALQSINTMRHFLTNIFYQIQNLFDLKNIVWSDNAINDGTFLNHLLEEASLKLNNDKLVILIDALDEIDHSSTQNNENVLFLPKSLPKNVFFVVTTRHKYDIRLCVSEDQKMIDIEASSENNIQDAKKYIQNRLSDKILQQKLVKWNVKSDEFIDILLNKSEGNFMYLRYVIPAIKKGAFIEGNLKELPDGLKAYYRCHWNQMKNIDIDTFSKFYQPIVCVLAAAKEAISIEQISSFTNIEEFQVKETINQWYEFLYEYVKEHKYLYRIYHSSFQEFLKEEVDPELKTYNGMIAKYYMRLSKM